MTTRENHRRAIDQISPKTVYLDRYETLKVKIISISRLAKKDYQGCGRLLHVKLLTCRCINVTKLLC